MHAATPTITLRATSRAARVSARVARAPSARVVRRPASTRAEVGAFTPSPRRRASIARAADGEDASAPSPSSFDGFSTAPSDADAALIADMVTEIKDWLKLLYVKREMSFNEVKLTIGIEDPRLTENRERYGIEDESGVSADEKVETLEMIERGETPTDARAVATVLDEFRNWPGLDKDVDQSGVDAGPSRYEEIAMRSAGIKTANPRRIRAKEEAEEEKEGTIFGFLPLYLVSAVPIFITIFAVGIMFVNSLQ